MDCIRDFAITFAVLLQGYSMFSIIARMSDSGNKKSPFQMKRRPGMEYLLLNLFNQALMLLRGFVVVDAYQQQVS